MSATTTIHDDKAGDAARRLRFRPFPWGAALLVLGVFSLAPALGFLGLMRGGSLGTALTLSPVQWAAIRETGMLLAGVLALAGTLGLVSAWLVTIYDFPLRRALEIALVLPLAFPTYLAAYVAVDMFDFFGPVQSLYRALIGARTLADYAFFDMRTLPAAIIVMALVLFPYVYVSCRLVFSQGGRNVIDVARLLGARSFGLFFRIGVPLAWPALAAGSLLVAIEALNDIGLTQHLGVSSFSVVISDLWLNRSDLPAAARLAGVLILTLALVAYLLRPRRASVAPPPGRGAAPPRPIRLKGWAAAGAMTATGLPVFAGFVMPVAFLLWRALQYAADQAIEPEFLAAATSSLALGVAVSLAAMLLGAALTIAIRIAPRLAPAAKIAALGYAIPGTVLVLAIFPVLRLADDTLGAFGVGVLASGTFAAMVYALTVRFVGIGAGQAGLALSRLPQSVDWVARVHGMRDGRLALHVHLPAMAPGLMLGGTLVFIDTVKELPATLLLRPLNFETLATRAYQQASVGLFEHAALESLAIILLSGVAALFLTRRV